MSSTACGVLARRCSRPASGPRQDASPLPSFRKSVHEPGNCSSRIVCPVGAVSKTMWSYCGRRRRSAATVNSLNEATSVVHEPDNCSVIAAISAAGQQVSHRSHDLLAVGRRGLLRIDLEGVRPGTGSP